MKSVCDHDSHACSSVSLSCAGALPGGAGPARASGGAEGVVWGAELLREQGGHSHFSLEVDIKTPSLQPGAHSTEPAEDLRMERNHKQRE